MVRIGGKRMYLWRAVDHEGEVLDMLVQSRRDSRAALRVMRKLLKKTGLRAEVTDKLRSYASPGREHARPGPGFARWVRAAPHRFAVAALGGRPRRRVALEAFASAAEADLGLLAGGVLLTRVSTRSAVSRSIN